MGAANSRFAYSGASMGEISESCDSGQFKGTNGYIYCINITSSQFVLFPALLFRVWGDTHVARHGRRACDIVTFAVLYLLFQQGNALI